MSRWPLRGVAAVVALCLAMTLGGCGSHPSAPWCADFNHQERIECSFSSFEQCRASVAGVGGSCMPNPAGGSDRPRRLR